jgi:hypothetical protein
MNPAPLASSHLNWRSRRPEPLLSWSNPLTYFINDPDDAPALDG